jgi:hypothetical protein
VCTYVRSGSVETTFVASLVRQRHALCISAVILTQVRTLMSMLTYHISLWLTEGYPSVGSGRCGPSDYKRLPVTLIPHVSSIPTDSVAPEEAPRSHPWRTCSGPVPSAMESPHTHLAYYPVPFAILVAWISYIVFMFVQLEDAVTISNWGGFTNSRQEVLTLLLTVFAQAHTPITAMVLTRLAVGALSSDGESSSTKSIGQN